MTVATDLKDPSSKGRLEESRACSALNERDRISAHRASPITHCSMQDLSLSCFDFPLRAVASVGQLRTVDGHFAVLVWLRTLGLRSVRAAQ